MVNSNIIAVHQHLQMSISRILVLRETQLKPTSNATHLLCPGNKLHTKFQLKNRNNFLLLQRNTVRWLIHQKIEEVFVTQCARYSTLEPHAKRPPKISKVFNHRTIRHILDGLNVAKPAGIPLLILMKCTYDSAMQSLSTLYFPSPSLH